MKNLFLTNSQESFNVNFDNYTTSDRNMKTTLYNDHLTISRFFENSIDLRIQYKLNITLSILILATIQLFYVFFDKANFESTSNSSAYVLTNISFSDFFIKHKKRKIVTIDAIDNATINKNLKRNSKIYILLQAIDNELENSI